MGLRCVCGAGYETTVHVSEEADKASTMTRGVLYPPNLTQLPVSSPKFMLSNLAISSKARPRKCVFRRCRVSANDSCPVCFSAPLIGWMRLNSPF